MHSSTYATQSPQSGGPRQGDVRGLGVEADVIQNLTRLGWLSDERDEAHLPGAQRGQLVDAGNQRRLQGMRGCRLGHAPDAARGTHTTALAGERHEEVVAAIVTVDAGKAVSKNAAFEVFAKGLLDLHSRGRVVTLAVELTGTGQLQPGLKVISDCAAQQGLLGVPGVDSTFRGGVTAA